MRIQDWRDLYEQHGYECSMKGITALSFDAWLMQKADSVISELKHEIASMAENNVSKSSYDDAKMRISQLELQLRDAKSDAEFKASRKCAASGCDAILDNDMDSLCSACLLKFSGLIAGDKRK